MCNRKNQEKSTENLADYYSADYDKVLEEIYGPVYHENGFDHKATPIVTVEQPKRLVLYNWGLIPPWSKDLPSALAMRKGNLNARSEELLEKASFRDILKKGQRCLIPATSFFEHQWLNPSKQSSLKFPWNIRMKDQPLFSFGGLYSEWTDRNTGTMHLTYTILTTRSNGLMSKIHNSGLRQPVIIPREYEQDWLNADLSEDAFKAICQPIDESLMKAYTVSRLLTNNKVNNDVPDVLRPFTYHELTIDAPTLF